MNAQELRSLSPEELLEHLESMVKAARAALPDYPRPTNTPPGMNMPVCQMGDIEVWPRNWKTEHQCHECGSPCLGMMIVRGPMAFALEAPERHFCSLKCYWRWVHDETENHNAGGLISGERKWPFPTGRQN